MRDELRAKNLHDTEDPPLQKSDGPSPAEARGLRTNDGTYNDLGCPRMGSAGVALRPQLPARARRSPTPPTC